MPVLHLVEAVFAGREHDGGQSLDFLTSVAVVHSPAQSPFCEHQQRDSRRQRWCCCSASSAGEGLGDAGKAAMRGDGLDCCGRRPRQPWCQRRPRHLGGGGIVAPAGRGVGDRDVTCLLSVSCCARSAVFSRKPVFWGMDEHLLGQPARLAYPLESGRPPRESAEDLKRPPAQTAAWR